MSYIINKTDGNAIVVLDGTQDTTSTSLTLLGRLATNYGEAQNENFVRLLENFSYETPPSNPIEGQLWYDRTAGIDNLKVYNGTDWETVGSRIVGNVSLTGNLFVGPNSFRIQDVNQQQVSLTNFRNNSNIAFVSNVAGTQTTTLLINGNDGLVTVAANATAPFGVTTKIYVDSELNVLRANLISTLGIDLGPINSSINSLNLSVSDIYSNLALRTETDNNLLARITAANVNIATNTANIANINALLPTLAPKNSPALTGIPTAPTPDINANTTQIATTAYVRAAINAIPEISLIEYATINSPTFTGVPRAPTPAPGTNDTQIATTAFVAGSIPATIPTGVIVMWYGSIATIPGGWYLCDGNNGTPDLRDKFIIGAAADSGGPARTNVTGSYTKTGGSKDSVTVSHTHGITDPGHRHFVLEGTPSFNGDQKVDYFDTLASSASTQQTISRVQSATTGISINTVGESGTNKNLPPYYALCFIMKA